MATKEQAIELERKIREAARNGDQEYLDFCEKKMQGYPNSLKYMKQIVDEERQKITEGSGIKPNYWLCGGGDLNCDSWDDVNGCWNGCKEFGDENCDPPNDEEEDIDCIGCDNGYPYQPDIGAVDIACQFGEGECKPIKKGGEKQ